MNTKGKMAPLVTVLVVVAILVLVVGAFFVIKNAAFISPSPGSGGSTTDCNIAPSLAFSTFNDLAKGSPVTTVKTVILNGVLQTPGTIPSSFQYGDKVQVLYNASGYLSVIGDEHTMTCGTNTLNQGIYASASPTVRIFNTDGNRVGNAILDSCILNNVVNQTQSTASISMKVEIQSAPLQSSGDMVLTVEYANNTQVAHDGITLSGTGVTDGVAFSGYATNATTTTVRAFNLPASENGALSTYYLNIAPKSGYTLGTNTLGTEVYLTLYSKQAYYDTDGTFKTGIENAQGTVKYLDTSRTGFCIVGTGS